MMNKDLGKGKKKKKGGTVTNSIEKHSFKISIGMAIIVILFLLGTSMQFATWKTNIEIQQSTFLKKEEYNVNRAECLATHAELDDRITHVGEKIVDMRSSINFLIAKASERDVELATINTKLANIEALLLEIRQDLKNEQPN